MKDTIDTLLSWMILGGIFYGGYVFGKNKERVDVLEGYKNVCGENECDSEKEEA